MSKAKVLICPAHYLFSDKYGSEPLWAYELVGSISQHYPVDVLVGVIDTNQPMPANMTVIPIYRSRSTSVTVEFIRRLLFYPLLTLKYIALNYRNNYLIVHHMFPLSFASFNPSILLAKYLFKQRVVLGPLQLPQNINSTADLGVVLTGSSSTGWAITGIGLIYALLIKIVKPLSYGMFRSATVIVCNTLASKQYYQKIFSQTFRVIPTGIRIPKQNQRSVKGSVVKILCVGQLVERKGQQYLLEAIRNLVTKYPHIQLSLVGEGEEFTRYQQFINENKLNKWVIMTGWVTRDKVGDLYREHDIFCLPSLSDPSPTVILEAMAYGLPIVASDVGAIKELVGDGGYVVPARSSQQLAQRLEQLINDGTLRKHLGSLGYRRVGSHYEWNRIAEQYRDLYTELGK